MKVYSIAINNETKHIGLSKDILKKAWDIAKENPTKTVTFEVWDKENKLSSKVINPNIQCIYVAYTINDTTQNVYVGFNYDSAIIALKKCCMLPEHKGEITKRILETWLNEELLFAEEI